MNVLNRLTAVVAHVGNNTVTVGQTATFGYSGNGFEDVCNKVAVMGSNCIGGVDVGLGDNDNVNGCLGSDVVEG